MHERRETQAGTPSGDGRFTKGYDPRRYRGGRRRKPKVESPYTCPFCYKPIGRMVERKGLSMEQIPDRLRQLRAMKRCTGQPRKGRRGFEKGPDPARCKVGRPIGSRDRYPRVPARCRHCGKRITGEWRRYMVKRWRHRNRR